jgi:hypothetical protein
MEDILFMMNNMDIEKKDKIFILPQSFLNCQYIEFCLEEGRKYDVIDVLKVFNYSIDILNLVAINSSNYIVNVENDKYYSIFLDVESMHEEVKDYSFFLNDLDTLYNFLNLLYLNNNYNIYQFKYFLTIPTFYKYYSSHFDLNLFIKSISSQIIKKEKQKKNTKKISFCIHENLYLYMKNNNFSEINVISQEDFHNIYYSENGKKILTILNFIIFNDKNVVCPPFSEFQLHIEKDCNKILSLNSDYYIEFELVVEDYKLKIYKLELQNIKNI